MQTQLEMLDWVFVVGYCVLALAAGVYLSRRAGKSIEQYFVAGRSLPWWVAGTSIVATSFASDTPLVVSGIIRKEGIWGNWIWWYAILAGLLCTFFFAPLWRRAAVITDVEFVELRYEGRSAMVLRGVMALYFGVVKNCIIIGWVMLAMAKVCKVMLDWNAVTSLTVLAVVALIYTLLSGFWGVVITDLFQFVIAMFGAVMLAGIVLWDVGGPSEMVSKITASGADAGVMNLLPSRPWASNLNIATFVISISALWMGSELAQGSGFLAQRLFATKNEKHAMYASLWFNFAHYVIRPWPWIIVGLASLIYLPITDLADPEEAYPRMMAKFLPVGLRGLMVASFLAAFMSTIDTLLNWGSSYLVNDVYKRFIYKDGSPRHYVAVSRLACLLIIVLGAITAWQQESIKEAWIYLMVMTSGIGVVWLLRWYWWRVNAWAEISALLGSLLMANGNLLVKLAAKLGLVSESTQQSIHWFYTEEDTWAVRALVVIVSCTVIWLIVAFLTPAVSAEHLERFYRRVRPGGWWGPIARRCPDVSGDGGMGYRWLAWLSAAICIYSGLFGIGHICLDRTGQGSWCLAVSVIAAILCRYAIRRVVRSM